VTVNGERARLPTRQYGCAGGKTPEGRTLDVAAGCNKPARPSADETVEDVRNVEDGAMGCGRPRGDALG
jgi:hypothetical protein